jgi:hypothetical protein
MKRLWIVHSLGRAVAFTCRARARGLLWVCRATDPGARIEGPK